MGNTRYRTDNKASPWLDIGHGEEGGMSKKGVVSSLSMMLNRVVGISESVCKLRVEEKVSASQHPLQIILS